MANDGELLEILRQTLPARDQHGLTVEEVGDDGVRLRFPFSDTFIGPGEIFSGPTLLSFADTAIFAAIQARIGRAGAGIVSTLNASFLRPAKPADIIALARVIRLGKKSAHAEAWLFSHVPVDPILHATASCVIRPL